MNFFMEVAKLRAARTLWSRIMAGLGASPRSQMLRTHCQTSGVSLTEQDPYNNVVRPTIEAMSSEEHTSELQSLMRIQYAVFRLNKKNNQGFTLTQNARPPVRTTSTISKL